MKSSPKSVCGDYGIEFKDGKIVCTKPENITVFECETDEDELDEEGDGEEEIRVHAV